MGQSGNSNSDSTTNRSPEKDDTELSIPGGKTARKPSEINENDLPKGYITPKDSADIKPVTYKLDYESKKDKDGLLLAGKKHNKTELCDIWQLHDHSCTLKASSSKVPQTSEKRIPESELEVEINEIKAKDPKKPSDSKRFNVFKSLPFSEDPQVTRQISRVPTKSAVILKPIKFFSNFMRKPEVGVNLSNKEVDVEKRYDFAVRDDSQVEQPWWSWISNKFPIFKLKQNSYTLKRETEATQQDNTLRTEIESKDKNTAKNNIADRAHEPIDIEMDAKKPSPIDSTSVHESDGNVSKLNRDASKAQMSNVDSLENEQINELIINVTSQRQDSAITKLQEKVDAIDYEDEIPRHKVAYSISKNTVLEEKSSTLFTQIAYTYTCGKVKSGPVASDDVKPPCYNVLPKAPKVDKDSMETDSEDSDVSDEIDVEKKDKQKKDEYRMGEQMKGDPKKEPVTLLTEAILKKQDGQIKKNEQETNEPDIKQTEEGQPKKEPATMPKDPIHNKNEKQKKHEQENNEPEKKEKDEDQHEKEPVTTPKQPILKKTPVKRTRKKCRPKKRPFANASGLEKNKTEGTTDESAKSEQSDGEQKDSKEKKRNSIKQAKPEEDEEQKPGNDGDAKEVKDKRTSVREKKGKKKSLIPRKSIKSDKKEDPDLKTTDEKTTSSDSEVKTKYKGQKKKEKQKKKALLEQKKAEANERKRRARLDDKTRCGVKVKKASKKTAVKPKAKTVVAKPEKPKTIKFKLGKKETPEKLEVKAGKTEKTEISEKPGTPAKPDKPVASETLPPNQQVKPPEPKRADLTPAESTPTEPKKERSKLKMPKMPKVPKMPKIAKIRSKSALETEASKAWKRFLQKQEQDIKYPCDVHEDDEEYPDERRPSGVSMQRAKYMMRRLTDSIASDPRKPKDAFDYESEFYKPCPIRDVREQPDRKEKFYVWKPTEKVPLDDEDEYDTYLTDSLKDNPTQTGYFRDEQRRIDMVLVVNDTARPEAEIAKAIFLRNCVNAGLELEIETGVRRKNKDYIFIKVHAPDQMLLLLEKHYGTKKYFKNNHLGFMKDNVHGEKEFVRAIRHNYPGPADLSTEQRIALVYRFLRSVPFGDEVNFRGIQKLLDSCVFVDMFALHDGPYFLLRGSYQGSNQLNGRQALYYTWVGFPNMGSPQPLHIVREYFGERVAYLFAFYEYYNRWLLVLAVLGFVYAAAGHHVYFYRTASFSGACTKQRVDMGVVIPRSVEYTAMGVVTAAFSYWRSFHENTSVACTAFKFWPCPFNYSMVSVTYKKMTGYHYRYIGTLTVTRFLVKTVYERKINDDLPVCPKCSDFRTCPFINMSSYCEDVNFKIYLDNPFSVLFIACIFVWGVVLAILWRRRENYLGWLWDVGDIDNANIVSSEYLRIIYNFPGEEWLTGIVVNIFCNFCMIAAFLLYIIALIVYEYKMTEVMVYTSKSVHALMRGRWITFASIGLINGYFIIGYEAMYTRLSSYLCRAWHHHRSEQRYECAGVVMLFGYSVIANYGYICYLAFVKGAMYTFPGDASRWQLPFQLGTTHCGLLSCIDEVAIVYVATFVGKHCFCEVVDMFEDRPNDMGLGLWANQHVPCWEREFDLLPVTDNHVLYKYNTIVLQIMSLSLFSWLFPLGAIPAIVYNIFQMKSDASRFVLNNRRPLLTRSWGLGVWHYVLYALPHFVGLLNIISIVRLSSVLSRMIHRLNYPGTRYFVDFALGLYPTTAFYDGKDPKGPFEPGTPADEWYQYVLNGAKNGSNIYPFWREIQFCFFPNMYVGRMQYNSSTQAINPNNDFRPSMNYLQLMWQKVLLVVAFEQLSIVLAIILRLWMDRIQEEVLEARNTERLIVSSQYQQEDLQFLKNKCD